MKVFFSYSHDDTLAVRAIQQALPDDIQTWVDGDHLTIGDSLSASISNAVRSADYVIVFVSASAEASTWVRRELSWAEEIETKEGRPFTLVVRLDGSRDAITGFQRFVHDRIVSTLRTRDQSGIRACALELTNLLRMRLAKDFAEIRRRSPRISASVPYIEKRNDVDRVARETARGILHVLDAKKGAPVDFEELIDKLRIPELDGLNRENIRRRIGHTPGGWTASRCLA